MSYELNKDRYHDMNEERTLNLISACDIEIPIPKSDYSYFMKDPCYLDSVITNEFYIANMFNDSELKKQFRDNLHLSLLPDFRKNNFYLGYSPKEIITSIYDILGIKKEVKIKYSNPLEFEYQRNEIKKQLKQHIDSLNKEINTIEDCLNRCDNSKDYAYLCKQYDILTTKFDFAVSALNNVDQIFDNIYNFRGTLEYTTVDGKEVVKQPDYPICWKNLAFYLAARSLKIYENDIKHNKLYLEFPYKIYEKCSSVGENRKQMEWVEELYLEDEYFDPKFINFNNKCKRIFEDSTLGLEFLLNYRDNNKILVTSTLNPSSVDLKEDEFDDFIEATRPKNNVKKTHGYDIERANRDLDNKKEFYGKGSEFSKCVHTRMFLRDGSMAGYMGFILNNDYIVLEKFFDLKINGGNKIAIDSAVYALPLDIYEQCDRDSGKIREYKKEEKPKSHLILHKYHTASKSYQDALLELTKKQSESLIKAENFKTYVNTDRTLKKKPKKKKNKKD